MRNGSGKLIIVSAPSGAGKTTLVKHLLQTIDGLRFSVSATSRVQRLNEENGKDYYFLSSDDFKQKIESGEFLEWEEVYQGVFYGTLKTEVERITSEGLHVIFDVDVVGGLNIKKQFPDNSISIFIQPPSLLDLEKRLRNRCSDSEESIMKRIEKSSKEMEYAKSFDVIVVNDQIEAAKSDICELVNNFIQS